MYVYSKQFKSGVLRDTGPIFVSVLTYSLNELLYKK